MIYDHMERRLHIGVPYHQVQFNLSMFFPELCREIVSSERDLFKLPTPLGCLTQVELPFDVLMGQEALKTLLLRDFLKRFRYSNEGFAIIGIDLSDLPFQAIKRLRILQK